MEDKASVISPRSDKRGGNELLASLPLEHYNQWKDHLRLVDLPLGQSLYEAGRESSSVIFPVSCIVSLLQAMENGASTEIAVVGCEGVVGVQLFMGGRSTLSRAVVQSAGTALELPADMLLKEFEKGGPVMHLLLRYTQVLITQMAQTAVCNRHHTLHQQLCRWLLESLDRLVGNELTMTQELIGNMLGVRRSGVTEAARVLQDLGAIQYRRGRITVLDRAILEQRACECYGVVKAETRRLLPKGTAK
jgi:CRP-like cAMP-binding protein